MAIKLGINGFGRIGRAAFKIALTNPEIEVVAINDLGDLENLAYLLRYDSIYGRYSQPVSLVPPDKGGVGGLQVGDKAVEVYQEKEPAKLPWGKLGVDVVVESTGVFTEEEGARGHIQGGAKRVIISAPTKSEGLSTVVLGVNTDEANGKDIISNASCTTNNTAPVMAILDETFGVEKGMLTTAHAYTATQELVDGPVKKDFRRGRAASLNMVPSTTGAAEAVIATLPQLKGKFDGLALRIPVPIVSISDVTCVLGKDATVEEINNAFIEAANSDRFRGILAVANEPTVSTDFIGDPHSAIVDLTLTRVTAGNLVKVMAWYDNEWGYSNRLVEQVVQVGTEVAN